MVWCILLGILLFLLFYPIVFTVDLQYENEDWQGNAVLYPFFTLSRIKITLWDSKRQKKEKPPNKEKSAKQQKKEAATAEKKAKKKKKKSIWEQLKNQPLTETIEMALSLLKTMGRGIKRLRVHLSFGYAMSDPAEMGYITGAIYAVVPIFLGDTRKTRWRIGIYPQWQKTDTMGFFKGTITICLFDLFYAFGGVVKKIVTLLIDTLRRK